MGWELITPDSLAELDSSQNTKLGGISTEANKTTFPTNNTEGQFSFAIDGTTTTNDVFSSAERTKLNRLRAGQAPDDASVSIKNNAITYGISTSNVEEIDNINILNATLNAMNKAADIAYKKYSFKPHW